MLENPTMANDRNQSLGLAELANIISDSAQTLDAFIEDQGRERLSFSPGESIDDLPMEDADILRTRQTLLEATTELLDLILGPTKLITPSVGLFMMF